MCCRCYFDESEEFREFIELMNRSPLTDRWKATHDIVTQGEVFPSNVVPVIAPDRRGQRAVFPMKWGYTGKSLLVNARSETAAVKPTFREDWQKHRCAIPASWYFEWEHYTGDDGRKHTGTKYMIRPEEGLTWLCGLYRIENNLPVFVVLTREPGEGIRFIHDRMPLILPGRLVDEWICPDTKPEELLPYAVTDVRFEKAE